MENVAAHEVLAEVNRRHGTGFALVRRLAGGHQSGAYLLQVRSGELAVLKWSEVVSWAVQVQRAAPVIARMRALGWPTPAWLHVGVLGDGRPYQVQEFVAGQMMSTLAEEETALLLRLVYSHADLDPDPGRDWSEHVKACVFGNRDGAREALRQSGPEGAAIVEAFVTLCEPHRDLEMPTGDLVHGDLSTENVLVANGQIAGVIDVEGIGSGTRVIDLANLLREGYLGGNATPQALQRIRQAAESVAGVEVLRICTAASVFGVLEFVLRRKPDRATRSIAPALRLAADLA